ncbi:hypothetical protein LLH23_13725 [bacterium]|nr:hypothetical protein [bacterium]
MALRVGAHRSNITPHLGCHLAGYFQDRLAADVADELQARTVVFESDDTALACCVLDLIVADQVYLNAAKQRAQELTGIPADHIFISCTHTHYGPSPFTLGNVVCEEEYLQWAMVTVGDSVKLAQNRLRPAEVASASGACPEETHNRRWRMRDGSVRMNPGYQNPDMVEPAGPTDPEVVLLVARDADTQDPIAALANYSLHYVGGPYHDRVSADYFGYFDRALTRMAGGEFVAVMANGCCGDINNCDFTRPASAYPHPFYQAERVANRVAAAAYYAWLGIRDYDAAPALGVAHETVTFTRREPSADELAAARALRESKHDPADLDWIYAGELIGVSEEPLHRPTPVMALRVGDAGIVGLPGEMFVQYGLQIKRRSPFDRTLTVELANDYVGYCPTDRALDEGSYETRLARTAKAARGTEGLFVEAAVRLLNQLA